MSLCRSCGAKIKWIETKNGKKMPVDPDYIDYEDAEVGDLLILDSGESIKVGPDSLLSYQGRVSHFSTCPQGDVWRKK